MKSYWIFLGRFVRRVGKRVWITSGTVLAVTIIVVVLAARALPALTPRVTLSSAEAVTEPLKPAMEWSPYGEQAITVVGRSDLTASSGKNDKAPVASIAKVMTALVILQEKPLKAGEQGSSMTFTPADVAVYQRELAQNQSVVEVRAGEQMTEYQLLEAMLVPSATNVADSAAVWAFGSMDAYLAKANQYAAQLGMNDTHFASDASGFSPDSQSTPQDLLKLGAAAMNNPTVAEIVGKQTVDLPVAGTLHNFNIMLGTEDINGIKTGNTDQAGGAFLFSAPFGDQTIVGIMLGSVNLGTALHDSAEVLQAYKTTIQVSTLLKAGQKVGEYNMPWGGSVDAVAAKPISVLEWTGSNTPVSVKLRPTHAGAKAGDVVGTATVVFQGKTLQTNVVLAKSISTPNIWWRIFR